MTSGERGAYGSTGGARPSLAAPAPPGPTAEVSVQAMRGDPLRFITEQTARYGDIVRYQVDGRPVTLVNHPDSIKHVLQDHHRNYSKHDTPDFLLLKPMLGDGLLTSEGASWLRQRRMAQPAFHRQRIEAFGTLITDQTSALLDEWAVAAELNRPVELVEQMTRLTLRIVAQALFGYEVGSTAERFGWAVQVLNECMGHFDPTDRSALGNFRPAMAVIRDIVQRMIDQRRAAPADSADCLGLLLLAYDGETDERARDQQLQDQVLTLLLAGHETTAKALSWTLYLLNRHPDVQGRLVAEVRHALGERIPGVQDLERLPYTWMVIQEALRLYPPVWIVSRSCVADDMIAGYHIPAGSLVTISPYAMHRHPRFWAQPERFDPERFRPELEAARPAFAYLPFSGGPRLCLGKHFASLEAHLVLATIMGRYTLSLVAGFPVEPEALVTLRPRFGLPMTIHRLATQAKEMEA